MATPLDWCCVAFGIACCGWQCNRLLKFGSEDSRGWLDASPEEVQELFYYAQLNLAAYAESVERMDERTDRIIAENVINFVGENENRRAPPYFIYINHEKKDIALMLRGLNMASKKDFWVLMRKKVKKYNHGYVHRGMFKAAQWVLEQEERILKRHCTSHPDYTLSIVGHSLGAGIATLLCVLLHDDPSRVGIALKDKNRIRAICFAPPRVISRNHVVNYSHAIRAVVLQDDFFSRVDTSVVQHIFLGFTGVGLACILFRACLADYLLMSGRRLRDPERLFPPGKLYHMVYKEAWHCGKVEPKVLTATPTGGRFEKLILSLSATGDHHIRNYNRHLLNSLEGLGFSEPAETQLSAPVAQRLARTASVDADGMAVEDERKPSGNPGKYRPRKSYEVTLEGTSSNVEKYREEIASIRSEEEEEEAEQTERNEELEREVLQRIQTLAQEQEDREREVEMGKPQELERAESSGSVRESGRGESQRMPELERDREEQKVEKGDLQTMQELEGEGSEGRREVSRGEPQRMQELERAYRTGRGEELGTGKPDGIEREAERAQGSHRRELGRGEPETEEIKREVERAERTERKEKRERMERRERIEGYLESVQEAASPRSLNEGEIWPFESPSRSRLSEQATEREVEAGRAATEENASPRERSRSSGSERGRHSTEGDAMPREKGREEADVVRRKRDASSEESWKLRRAPSASTENETNNSTFAFLRRWILWEQPERDRAHAGKELGS